jgi:hypothetical protein
MTQRRRHMSKQGTESDYPTRRAAKQARRRLGVQRTHRVVRFFDSLNQSWFRLVELPYKRPLKGDLVTGHLTLQSYAGNRTPEGWKV